MRNWKAFCDRQPGGREIHLSSDGKVEVITTRQIAVSNYVFVAVMVALFVLALLGTGSYTQQSDVNEQDILAYYNSQHYVNSVLRFPPDATFPDYLPVYVRTSGEGRYEVESFVEWTDRCGNEHKASYSCRLCCDEDGQYAAESLKITESDLINQP